MFDRARRVDADGLIKPSVPFETFRDSISSIRDSRGGIYNCDLSIEVMSWRCFTEMHKLTQPFKWMGNRKTPHL